MDQKPSNWNVPNALTTLRIIMVPFFGWALLTEGGTNPVWRWVAFGLFVGAMITDKIDGDLARKHNLITDFGKIADPIADKAITGMAFIGLAIIHPFMPAWLWWTITVVVLVREWAVTIARLSIAKHVVLAANSSGKVKTVFQTIGLAGFVLPFDSFPAGWMHTVGMGLWWLAGAFLAASVWLTVSSGIEFARDAAHQRREAKYGAAS
ncbi:MAG: CDP-alcohol phosphatidyltransferase family protein [Marmoricola sp.]|jgi:CDP-diacylglycerol--glycerol-3-phosphate 3-phosphatidyltransferase